MRLVGGNTPLEGQVEVCINGAWGTICDGDGWSNADAAVVCRQRGFETQGQESAHYINQTLIKLLSCYF